MEPEAYMTDGGPVKNRFTACRRLYWVLLWPLAAGYLRRGCPGLLYPPAASGPSGLPDTEASAVSGHGQVPAETGAGDNLLIACFSLWDNAPWGRPVQTPRPAHGGRPIGRVTPDLPGRADSTFP